MYDTLRMISKRAVYIVIAIALTRVVGKAYQQGGGWYASCVIESGSKEYTLSIPTMERHHYCLLMFLYLCNVLTGEVASL